MTQLALLDVTTGDEATDRVVAMIRGAQAALRTPTPRREGCHVVSAEVAFVFDPAAPLEETLALFIESAFVGWREAVRWTRGDTTSPEVTP